MPLLIRVWLTEHLLSFWSKVVEKNTHFLDPLSLKFAIKTWNDEKLDGRSNLKLSYKKLSTDPHLQTDCETRNDRSLVLGEVSLETLKKFSRVVRLARGGHHGAWRQQVGGEKGVENKPLKPQSGLTPADTVKVLSNAERTSDTRYFSFLSAASPVCMSLHVCLACLEPLRDHLLFIPFRDG